MGYKEVQQDENKAHVKNKTKEEKKRRVIK